MQIEIGLTAGDLISKFHGIVRLSSQTGLSLRPSGGGGGRRLIEVKGRSLLIRAEGSSLVVHADDQGAVRLDCPIIVSAGSSKGIINLEGMKAGGIAPKPGSKYSGEIKVGARGGRLTLSLLCDLETYVEGVLQSEVPASFHLEAMKAQAVLARTYGLNPRVNHAADGFVVCDSYLCCQAFSGANAGLTRLQRQAIEATTGQILIYNGKPALALFSACAGGHTESYENCFSDPVTQAFPLPPVPYLRGVPEGKLPDGYPGEKALRQLFHLEHADTCDAWSASFKWTVRLSADCLEGQMHHVIAELRKDPQFAPFILAPASGVFGHIERFEITERGVAGTGISMSIHTSKGRWTVRKELTIRSVFGNAPLGLKRLKSARLFFDHAFDRLGLLSELSISGFGSGHGVGLQQAGAQGLALKGLSVKEILAHYYQGASLGSAQRALDQSP